MTNLIPLEDHIIVEPVETEATTKSGIILPTSKEEKPGQGLVIAVGPGRILEDGKRGPMDVKIGDTIFFTKYAPDEITLKDENGEDKKYLCIKQTSVLAKQAK